MQFEKFVFGPIVMLILFITEKILYITFLFSFLASPFWLGEDHNGFYLAKAIYVHRYFVYCRPFNEV